MFKQTLLQTFAFFRSRLAGTGSQRSDETFDRDRRIELLRGLYRLVHEKQPCIFLYTPKQAYVWRDEIEMGQFGPVRPDALRWYLSERARRARLKVGR